MKYFYYCEYNDTRLKPDPEQAYFDFNSDYKIRYENGVIDEWTCQWLAENIAEDFHQNHDGWEYLSWNKGSDAMVFFVFDENKKFLFAQAVYIDIKPSFSAREYKVEQ